MSPPKEVLKRICNYFIWPRAIKLRIAPKTQNLTSNTKKKMQRTSTGTFTPNKHEISTGDLVTETSTSI